MVTTFEWINPHALLYVDGKDADGKAGSWKFEMGSPGPGEPRMEKDGFEELRPDHSGWVRREGWEKRGQCPHGEVGGWAEAVRGIPVHPW
jgi:hypothetical protein